MKQLLSLIVITIILCLSQTKDTNAQNLRFGLQFTPEFTSLKIQSDSIESRGASLRMSYGIVADYFFGDSDRYAFSSGLILNPVKGSFDVNDTTGMEVVTKVKYQYLEIPLMLKMRTEQIGPFKYFVQAGLTPSVALRTRYFINALDLENKKGRKITRPFNTSATFGIGVEYPINDSDSMAAFGGLYYSRGISNVVNVRKTHIKEVPIEIADKDKFSTRNFGVRVGIFF